MKTSIIIMKNKILALTPLLTIIGVIALWWLSASIVGAQIILPSPKLVIQKMVELLTSLKFYKSLYNTIIRVIVSFLVSFLLALIFGFLASKFKAVEKALYPIIVLTRALPTMSIIFLCVIWFSSNVSPMFVSYLVLFPILYSSVISALNGVDKSLIEMSRVYRVPTKVQIFKFYLPSVAGRLYGDAISALSFNVKLVVAAEALAQTALGLGGGMQIAKANLETAELFAYAVIAVVVSYLLELIVRLIVMGVRYVRN